MSTTPSPSQLGDNPDGSSNVSSKPHAGPFPSSVIKDRISHACDRCRVMRTKCSGGKRCAKCIKDGTVCIYGDRKRERNKKDLVESLDRVQLLEEEIRDVLIALRMTVSKTEAKSELDPFVVGILAKYSNGKPSQSSASSRQADNLLQSFESTTSPPAAFSQVQGQPKSSRGGELYTTFDTCGSDLQENPSKLDNLLDSHTSTVLVGKMSEVFCLQQVREFLTNTAIGRRDVSRACIDGHLLAAQNLTYFVDDTSRLVLDEDRRDAFQWPSEEIAFLLSEAYFHSTYAAFQVISREPFLDKVRNTPRHGVGLSQKQRRWLAIANLIWAIGSRWLSLSKIGDDLSDGHLVYYARAQSSGLDDSSFFNHPTLETVEITILLAFYLLINDHFERSWNTLGTAIRLAIALGLHMEVLESSIGGSERDRRAKIWWSLRNLETLMAETTGRPQNLQRDPVTISPHALAQVPHALGKQNTDGNLYVASKYAWLRFLNARLEKLPQPKQTTFDWTASVLQDAALSSQHLFHRSWLCAISAEISESLYSGGSEDSWYRTRDIVSQLQYRLASWAESLPAAFAVRESSHGSPDPRGKLELAMYFHSVTILLHRPCLCEARTLGESDHSQAFIHTSARSCVHGAMSMLALIPEEPVIEEVMHTLPWWTLLHYICQAVAVLLLELCLECQHFRGQEEDILVATKKAMYYLAFMSEESTSAYRAWRICRVLLQQVSVRYNSPEVFALPTDILRPSSWTDHQESMIAAIFER